MSDEVTSANLQAGRLVLRLLALHHRHRNELDKARAALAERYAESARRELARGSAERGAGPRTGDAEGMSEEADWPALSAAAAIARDLAPEWQRRVLAKLPDGIAEEFLGAVYSFDSLPMLERREIQDVVRRVDGRALATALLGANESILSAVTSNMSSRAAQMLREDMESLLASGELRTSDVRAARGDVSRAVRRVRGIDDASRSGEGA